MVAMVDCILFHTVNGIDDAAEAHSDGLPLNEF